MSNGRAIRIQREAVQPWLPFVFCAFLSTMPIAGPLLALANGPMSSDWWLPTVLGFLPMCFFFAGSTMSQMRKEICALRTRVAALEASTGAGPGAARAEAGNPSSPPKQFSLKLLLAAVAVLAVQFALIAKLLGTIDGAVKAPLVAPRAPATVPPARRVRRVSPTPSVPAPAPRPPGGS